MTFCLSDLRNHASCRADCSNKDQIQSFVIHSSIGSIIGDQKTLGGSKYIRTMMVISETLLYIFLC